jgi:hypothetical protein
MFFFGFPIFCPTRERIFEDPPLCIFLSAVRELLFHKIHVNLLGMNNARTEIESDELSTSFRVHFRLNNIWELAIRTVT